jgi:hypothetical protein
MRCEFDDGLQVEYSGAGALRVIKGDEVNLFLKDGCVPEDLRSELEGANLSCAGLRSVAKKATERFGDKACIH